MDSKSTSSTDATIVCAWIDESYNAREEIISRIAEVKEQVPAIVLTLDKRMNRSELLEITRSCNSQVVRTVMSFLNHLTIITNISNLPQTYLPLDMNDNEIFQLLPHLLAEGLKFSLRPSALMAIFCILSNNKLPENNAYAFSKICVKVPQFFTENENLFFRKLYTLGGLKLNASTRIIVKQPFIPTVRQIHHDTKIQCQTCNIIRSTTLFPDVGKSCCALCLPCYDLKHTPEPCEAPFSHLVQCTTCTCLYAIVQYRQLFSTPKCHYCRNLSESAPYRRCIECQNKYVHNDSTEPIPSNGEEYKFVCAECQHSTVSKTIVDIPVSIGTLFDENKIQLYKYLNINDKVELNPMEDIQSSSISQISLVHAKKPILNPVAIFDQINTWIQSGKSESVTCYICCNDVSCDKINSTCGNKLCHAESCTECLTTWYQAVRPGSIVLVAHLLCPFCKHTPNVKVLKKYNKQACTILKFDKKDDIDERWYYGWCMDCYKIKKAQEKSCIGNVDIPSLTDFVCDECIEIRNSPKTIDIKYCPGINENTKAVCGVATNKKGSCNHITCTACNSDWCWLCVKTYGESIYEHLMSTHGNYGIEDDNDE
ncbi:unnamed protein product [Rotaria sp. Silwood1]|nr:unnamed protein product [Rotaria sp. Silwood1]